ncbi:N-acetylmuramoyl-L-alanine amidase [Virgibacillus necropolis]|uniref:N-acetylmuramoyl-L-alanine amidase n=1 Tax=Virgibacillus necropolis TaxID=163877 RepID=A0A221M8J6_9BACI|nr:N-acetylmuramoyl-L-alanine amidase [Virgibacillus necropolis]ASN03952.1 N-acetylmuramoyl-L-alanine amidase [Virgibacillus necropolis]
MKSIRFLFIGLSLLLLSIIISPIVDAHEGQTYEVGTSSLHVRIAPSHDAEILGQLTTGDQVVVFNEQHGWVQTYYGGKTAWVASQYLYPVENTKQDSSLTISETVTVNTNGVYVRSGPSTDDSIIGFATSGDTYTKIKTANDWHKVMLQDGSFGWIAAWLTDTYTPESVPKSEPKSTTKEPQNKPKQSGNGSLEGYTIVLDPGHGGNDPGAIGFNGVLEKDLTLSIAEKIAQYLRDAGATVELTRADDQYLSLEERTQFSSLFQTDAFISLHYNAYPFIAVNGIGTYYYESGKGLASSIQKKIGQQVALQDRGVHYGNFHVLRENSDLSVLVELGFITNPNDLFTIQTSAYQNNVAQAITDGVKKYFLR